MFLTIAVEGTIGRICPLKALRWIGYLAGNREIIALLLQSKNVAAGRKREIGIFWLHQKHFSVSSNRPNPKLI